MAEPTKKDFSIRIGCKFGPVTFQLAPLEDGGLVDIADAIVRIETKTGIRDSTVDDGEIVIDNVAKTVQWTMLEGQTAELTPGMLRGRLIVIDSSGEDQEPGDLTIRATSRL